YRRRRPPGPRVLGHRDAGDERLRRGPAAPPTAQSRKHAAGGDDRAGGRRKISVVPRKRGSTTTWSNLSTRKPCACCSPTSNGWQSRVEAHSGLGPRRFMRWTPCPFGKAESVGRFPSYLDCARERLTLLVGNRPQHEMRGQVNADRVWEHYQGEPQPRCHARLRIFFTRFLTTFGSVVQSLQPATARWHALSIASSDSASASR